MNHSDVYWAHVASVMPDYMLAENWLKKHGNECVF
jgi:predicted metal-dependent hydrolase